MTETLDFPNLASRIVKIACQAGEAIMHFKKNPNTISIKADNSPVTDADHASNKIITSALNKITPAIPIISEENIANHHRKLPSCFWLIDPLDGTKEFIRGSNEFTVNIALIRKRKAVAGFIRAPAIHKSYFTETPNKAFCQQNDNTPTLMRTRKINKKKHVVLVSYSHRGTKTDQYLNNLNIKEIKSVGSSLKFCMIAEGVADTYPRFGRTMEWDTAAGHAIVNAAGGTVTQITTEPLLYGKKNFSNPDFICRG